VTDLVKPKMKLTDEERKRLTALTNKAQKGNRKALVEASQMLTEHRLWHVVGDMGRYAQDAWLDAAAGSNPLARKALEEQLRELRNELRGGGDSPLERVLIDRLVACWLQANYADWQHGTLIKKGSYSFAEGRYDQDRQDRAHRRLLQAAKTLATVRRLLAPAVQINVGQNQIITQTGGSDSA
jgi:hypothetical protein